MGRRKGEEGGAEGRGKEGGRGRREREGGRGRREREGGRGTRDGRERGREEEEIKRRIHYSISARLSKLLVFQSFS